MKIGLWGARADAGGLAAMTYEFARHMHPEKTMVIDLGTKGRGPAHPERYRWGEVRTNLGMNDDIALATVRDFLDGLDVVYMAETTYYEPFCDIARQAGVRTVLHAMPELWRKTDAQPDAIWLPTTWEAHRVPGARVVPVPIPTDTFSPEPVRQLAMAQRGTMLHMGAPAFHDRNGTELVLAAMRVMQVAAKIVFNVHQPPPPAVNRHGVRVTADWRPGGTYDRRDAYPADCGALLLPRRYAGLSLPMQEAAALGWPIISLDLAPQNEWLHPALLVPAEPHHVVRMVGGTFPVYHCNAHHLARAIETLYRDGNVWEEATKRSLARRDELSWDRWAATYRRLLQMRYPE